MKASTVGFWIEVILAAAALFVFVLTLVWQDWIERVFHVDPDHGNGSLEKVVLLCVAGAAVLVAAALAGRNRYLNGRTAAVAK